MPEPPASVVPITNIFQIPLGVNSSGSSNEKIVEVTPNLNNQKGAIFSTDNNILDMTDSFKARMYIYFGNEGTKAADGRIIFVNQQGDSTLLEESQATKLFSGTKTSQTTNIVDKWSDTNGLLLKINIGNYTGSYRGSID